MPSDSVRGPRSTVMRNQIEEIRSRSLRAAEWKMGWDVDESPFDLSQSRVENESRNRLRPRKGRNTAMHGCCEEGSRAHDGRTRIRARASTGEDDQGQGEQSFILLLN